MSVVFIMGGRAGALPLATVENPVVGTGEMSSRECGLLLGWERLTCRLIWLEPLGGLSSDRSKVFPSVLICCEVLVRLGWSTTSAGSAVGGGLTTADELTGFHRLAGCDLEVRRGFPARDPDAALSRAEGPRGYVWGWCPGRLGAVYPGGPTAFALLVGMYTE